MIPTTLIITNAPFKIISAESLMMIPTVVHETEEIKNRMKPIHTNGRFKAMISAPRSPEIVPVHLRRDTIDSPTTNIVLDFFPDDKLTIRKLLLDVVGIWTPSPR